MHSMSFLGLLAIVGFAAAKGAGKQAAPVDASQYPVKEYWAGDDCIKAANNVVGQTINYIHIAGTQGDQRPDELKGAKITDIVITPSFITNTVNSLDGDVVAQVLPAGRTLFTETFTDPKGQKWKVQFAVTAGGMCDEATQTTTYAPTPAPVKTYWAGDDCITTASNVVGQTINYVHIPGTKEDERPAELNGARITDLVITPPFIANTMNSLDGDVVAQVLPAGRTLFTMTFTDPKGQKWKADYAVTVGGFCDQQTTTPYPTTDKPVKTFYGGDYCQPTANNKVGADFSYIHLPDEAENTTPDFLETAFITNIVFTPPFFTNDKNSLKGDKLAVVLPAGKTAMVETFTDSTGQKWLENYSVTLGGFCDTPATYQG